MMKAPTLVEIRRFLMDEGCALEPWSSPEVVVQSLHDLLARKRDDERFWARLKVLTRRIDARHFDATALPDFEALGPAAVDRLVDELRSSVTPGATGRAQGRTAREWLQQGAGLGAVLVIVLGLSLSCDSGNEWGAADRAPEWTPESWECEAEAVNQTISDEADIDVLCQLGDYVKEAVVTDGTKQTVLNCLPDYDAAWRADLLEQFQAATGEELNALLLDLIDVGGDCEAPTYEDDDEHFGGGCDISTH